MIRWCGFGAAVVVVGLVGLVLRDWWRFPVVDPRLGYPEPNLWIRGPSEWRVLP